MTIATFLRSAEWLNPLAALDSGERGLRGTAERGSDFWRQTLYRRSGMLCR